jgi:beta-glucosidase
LEAWFPGIEAGPALVRTLFGDVSPSGHLPISYPRAVGQEPLYYNALNTGRPAPETVADDVTGDIQNESRYVSRYIDEASTPLFHFGHGLSYTTFEVSATTVNVSSISAHALNEEKASLQVSATVTNTGNREGAAVVQCYIRLTGTSVARPVRELKGFAKIRLAPRQTEQVVFPLGKSELSFWNSEMKNEVEPARLTVWIGRDCASGIPASVTIVR